MENGYGNHPSFDRINGLLSAMGGQERNWAPQRIETSDADREVSLIKEKEGRLIIADKPLPFPPLRTDEPHRNLKGENMKKHFALGLVTALFLCSGCTVHYLKPISNCQPLSAFDTVVISPFEGGSAQVEELKYLHLPQYFARVATERLKDKLEFYYLFPKVIQSSTCVDQAIKIEVRIDSLKHSLGSFYVGIRGRIVDCQSNKPLYIFEETEVNSATVKMPDQIADRIIMGIKDRLTCR
jgi:hypothetical protein